MPQHIRKAERFLLVCLGPLARIYDVEKKCWGSLYPAATGLLIAYFAKYYQIIPKEIWSAADFLLKIQHPLGGFFSYDSLEALYTFDTGLIMHSFLMLYRRTHNEAYLDAAKKCYSFISGAVLHPGEILPKYILKENCYTKSTDCHHIGGHEGCIQAKLLEGFLMLFSITNDIKIANFINEIANFSKVMQCVVRLTASMGYYLEGIFAVWGRDNLVLTELQNILETKTDKGFIPYYQGSSFACVSGSAQLAILLWKCGFKKEAKSISSWLKIVQANHPLGGLFQYANEDGSLNTDISKNITSWGTKYFCELEKLIYGYTKSFV
jgi:hypothetical protein